MTSSGPGLFAPLFEGRAPMRWLVTGAAGFIGSNLVQALLENGQSVVGLDDFSTGHRRNLDEVRAAVGEDTWRRFAFVEGDVCNAETCAWAVAGADVVLHQAALGSVPRSVHAPMKSFRPNAEGFARLLVAAKDAGVRRFVYASSSSVYGDHPALPKVEDAVGRVLSPYAATKAMDEAWAQGCSAVYDLQCVGLSYFNVFGPRQDPDGAYAAVIPRWIASMLGGESVWINGDGRTSRDFCYVANAVQANLRAGLVDALPSRHEVFNVAAGARTTLLELHDAILRALPRDAVAAPPPAPRFREFRPGDVRHSLADVSKAARLLGYAPTHDVAAGLGEAMRWYVGFLGGRRARGVRAVRAA